MLGSGGARGYAQIGVIQELLSRGHSVVGITGASIGALVGGALAAGRLEQLAKAATDLSKFDVMRMLQLNVGAPALVKSDAAMDFLRRYIGEHEISELQIPYAAVAADLRSRREIWFSSGSLLAAIRASISIPGVFSPVVLGDCLLVDGGLLNPLPMEISLRPDADLTLAVSLFGKDKPTIREKSLSESVPGATPEAESDPEPNGLFARLERLFSGSRNDPDSPFERPPADLKLLDVATMALDLMQERIQASRVAVNPPDLHIEIPASLGSAFDFDKGREFIDYGRDQACRLFDEVGL